MSERLTSPIPNLEGITFNLFIYCLGRGQKRQHEWWAGEPGRLCWGWARGDVPAGSDQMAVELWRRKYWTEWDIVTVEGPPPENVPAPITVYALRRDEQGQLRLRVSKHEFMFSGIDSLLDEQRLKLREDFALQDDLGLSEPGLDDYDELAKLMRTVNVTIR